MLGVGIGTITAAYGGFLLQRGLTTVNCSASTTTMSSGGALKAGTAILVACADNADNGEYVGSIVGYDLTNDTVLRYVMAYVSMGD